MKKGIVIGISITALIVIGVLYYLFAIRQEEGDVLTTYEDPGTIGQVAIDFGGISEPQIFDDGDLSVDFGSLNFEGFNITSSLGNTGDINLDTPQAPSLKQDVSTLDLSISDSSGGSTSESQPSSSPEASAPPANQGPTVSASECAQFNGVPSCSFIGDPQGRSLCEQCRAAGF